MLQTIIDIEKWPTSVKQITDGNAHHIFQSCIVSNQTIEEILTDIENHPGKLLEEAKKILQQKLHEIKTMQLEADDIMNQDFNTGRGQTHSSFPISGIGSS